MLEHEDDELCECGHEFKWHSDQHIALRSFRGCYVRLHEGYDIIDPYCRCVKFNLSFSQIVKNAQESRHEVGPKT